MWSSGIGSMPGGAVGSELDNARDYDEAQRVVLGEVSLPHLVEMPGRGAIASMVGRTLGLISELGFDLQPAGWRLSSRGVDQRRATSLLARFGWMNAFSQSVPPDYKALVCVFQASWSGSATGDVTSKRKLTSASAG